MCRCEQRIQHIYCLVAIIFVVTAITSSTLFIIRRRRCRLLFILRFAFGLFIRNILFFFIQCVCVCVFSASYSFHLRRFASFVLQNTIIIIIISEAFGIYEINPSICFQLVLISKNVCVLCVCVCVSFARHSYTIFFSSSFLIIILLLNSCDFKQHANNDFNKNHTSSHLYISWEAQWIRTICELNEIDGKRKVKKKNIMKLTR